MGGGRRHSRGPPRAGIKGTADIIDDVVKNGDSAKINQDLLDEAERLRKEAQP